MNFRILTLLALLIFLQASGFAQKKTTSVKGYYRKDGTYVKPHQRTYNSNSSTYSNDYRPANDGISKQHNTPDSTFTHDRIGNSILINNNINIVQSSNLVMVGLRDSDLSDQVRINKQLKRNNPKPTRLNQVSHNNDSAKLSSAVDNKVSIDTGIVVFLSVLRYKDKVIDICPISRNIIGDLEFNKFFHKFDSKLVENIDLFDLINKYDWTLKGGILYKSFYQSREYIQLPNFITISIESIKLK